MSKFTQTLIFMILFLTGCSQNVGYGIGVAGVSTSGNSVAATEIVSDSETNFYGNLTVGADMRL